MEICKIIDNWIFVFDIFIQWLIFPLLLIVVFICGMNGMKEWGTKGFGNTSLCMRKFCDK